MPINSPQIQSKVVGLVIICVFCVVSAFKSQMYVQSKFNLKC